MHFANKTKIKKKIIIQIVYQFLPQARSASNAFKRAANNMNCQYTHSHSHSNTHTCMWINTRTGIQMRIHYKNQNRKTVCLSEKSTEQMSYTPVAINIKSVYSIYGNWYFWQGILFGIKALNIYLLNQSDLCRSMHICVSNYSNLSKLFCV